MILKSEGSFGARKLILRIKTVRHIGIFNIIRVILYRLALKTRLHPVIYRKAEFATGHFFTPPPDSNSLLHPSQQWRKTALFFGWYKHPLNTGPPNWFLNPFSGNELVKGRSKPWWEINEFNTEVGDIKTVWELSRFDWVPVLAQRACKGDKEELGRLNKWLADWCDKNPPYLGPNWKCGQEAAIRVLHLALAARFLGQDNKPTPELIEMVRIHLMRISPTTSYAIAQNNNHATSEAAALFIGGSWCEKQGIKSGRYWRRKGRKIIENRVRKLFAADGTFSQNSVTYHRLVLDTLSVLELWRRWQGLKPFSPLFYERAKAAVKWLYIMVVTETGEAPNLGSNDGANLLSLLDTDYRDFRPSVQLASALFMQRRAYAEIDPAKPSDEKANYDLLLKWLGLESPEEQLPPPPAVNQFDDGGYAILRQGRTVVYFRYPRLHLKPGQCDALHIDLWLNAENILRDAGSFSYNTDSTWEDVFAGPGGHNTIQFDDRDQMPLIGRFRRGAWLEAEGVEAVKQEETDGWLEMAAAYSDWMKAYHHRRLKLQTDELIVEDTISGFNEKAVLRWRLAPGDWQLREKTVSCGEFSLTVSTPKPESSGIRCELVTGWESRYYMHKQEIPVFKVTLTESTEVSTRINWNSATFYSD
ncbi:MAG: heparinase II/III family protein [Lentisphaeria bacterium]